MKELIQQIGSYNLFNYFLPGTIYCAIIPEITSYNLVSDNIIISAFLFYFIGMVISRIGSVYIEYILKELKIIRFKNYKDFVEASKKDEKLNVLSEQNNTYRTLIALFICIAFTKGFSILEIEFEFAPQIKIWLIVLFLILLFIIAYKKQTNYITKRIEKNLED